MITDLRLRNFRSYANDSFEFSSSVNIIVGPNASGKTNLLEAVLIIARGGSYRAKDAELIKFKKPWARLESNLAVGGERIVKIENTEEKTKKLFNISGQVYQRLSLPKTLPTVLFEPNDLLMLGGAPERRRQFMDDLLEQAVPGFSTTRRQYKRTLAQRNTLLKKGHKAAKPQLFAWDVRLSELGSQIAHARAELVENMKSQAQDTYNSLSGSKNKIEFKYSSKISPKNYATDLLHKLEASAQTDFERGFTSHGPHRDDLQICIDDHFVQDAASRGETRSLLLVCKILEAKLLEQARGAKPALLLDDVFSELDGARRQALTKFLQNYQTFITTTDADVVIQHFTESANIIPLAK